MTVKSVTPRIRIVLSYVGEGVNMERNGNIAKAPSPTRRPSGLGGPWIPGGAGGDAVPRSKAGVVCFSKCEGHHWRGWSENEGADITFNKLLSKHSWQEWKTLLTTKKHVIKLIMWEFSKALSPPPRPAWGWTYDDTWLWGAWKGSSLFESPESF